VLLLTSEAQGHNRDGGGPHATEAVVRAEPSPEVSPAAGVAALHAWMEEQAESVATPGSLWQVSVRGDAETCRYAADLLATPTVSVASTPASWRRRHSATVTATVPGRSVGIVAGLLEAGAGADEILVTLRGGSRGFVLRYRPRDPSAEIRTVGGGSERGLGALEPVPAHRPPNTGARSVRNRRAAAIAAVSALAITGSIAGVALMLEHGQAPSAGPKVVDTRGAAGTPPDRPVSRRAAAATFDPVRSELVLVGGIGTNNAILSDTWTFDGRRWSRHDAGATPPARVGESLVYDPQTRLTLLIGGLRFLLVSLRDDMWGWDGTSWTPLHPEGDAPEPIVPGAASWYGSIGRVVYVCVCREEAGNSVQTWVWDGRRWWQQHPTHEPPLTHGALLSDVPAGPRLVLVEPDGRPGGGGQTWTYDGVDWRSAPEPGPRHLDDDATPAADPASGRLVLTGPSGATSTWDGTGWREAAPRVTTWQTVLFSDGSRLVLFGADVGRGVREWVWAQGSWVERSPPQHL